MTTSNGRPVAKRQRIDRSDDDGELHASGVCWMEMLVERISNMERALHGLVDHARFVAQHQPPFKLKGTLVGYADEGVVLDVTNAQTGGGRSNYVVVLHPAAEEMRGDYVGAPGVHVNDDSTLSFVHQSAYMDEEGNRRISLEFDTFVRRDMLSAHYVQKLCEAIGKLTYSPESLDDNLRVDIEWEQQRTHMRPESYGETGCPNPSIISLAFARFLASTLGKRLAACVGDTIDMCSDIPRFFIRDTTFQEANGVVVRLMRTVGMPHSALAKVEFVGVENELVPFVEPFCASRFCSVRTEKRLREMVAPMSPKDKHRVLLRLCDVVSRLSCGDAADDVVERLIHEGSA